MTEEEEVQVLVIDNGSDTLKVGFAGDECPRTVIPTVVGRRDDDAQFFAEEALCRSDLQTLSHPIEHGVIVNWDDMERLWRHTFFNELRVFPEDHAILLGLSPWCGKGVREKAAEIMFEVFHSIGLYTGNTSELTQLSSGHHSMDQSQIYVEMGGGVISVVPFFFDALSISATRSSIASGEALTKHLQNMLSVPGKTARDIKEKMCYVAQDYNAEMEKAANSSEVQMKYELPDGKVIVVGNERFRCPEALFHPGEISGCSSDRGLHELIADAIAQFPKDVTAWGLPAVVPSIVLSGGSSMFPGLAERLQKEVAALVPGYRRRIRVLPKGRDSAWIGGSILGSLSVFSEMLIFREEYDEYGPAIVSRKYFNFAS